MSDYFSYEEKERVKDLEKAILQYERDLYEREKHFNKEQIITELKAEIKQLKQQLAEKQNAIDEINKEFAQAIHDWKVLCVEKDKEIIQAVINKIKKEADKCFNFDSNGETPITKKALNIILNKIGENYE